MSLAAYQNAFRDLMMTAEGKHSLQSAEALEAYLKTTALSTEQQADFLGQSLQRLQQYEYMVEANVRDVTENIYPFCIQVLGEAWDAVYRDYFTRCPSQTYQLTGCAEALPGYLESRQDLLAQYPYLAELALYEWVEAELLSAEDPVYPDALEAKVPDTAEALALWVPVLNPNTLLMELQFPIPHLIELLKQKSALSPAEAVQKTTWVLVYREPETPVCRFFQLTPVLAAWLSLLQQDDDSQTYTASLQPVLEQLKQAGVVPSDHVFYESLLGMLPGLLEKQVLVGSCPSA